VGRAGRGLSGAVCWSVTLRKQLGDSVLDTFGGATVAEASGKAVEYPRAQGDLAQQQYAAVRSDPTTVERRLDAALAKT